MNRPAHLRRFPIPRAALLAVLATALLMTGLTPVRPAAPVAATTAQTMAADLLSWINSARSKHGLATLRTSSTLYSLASQRAATLASLNALSHDAAGCLTCQLKALGVSYNLMGEVLASNNYPWGTESASVVFSSWKNSSQHWDILMGASFDTIGIGVAESSNGTTYASAILIDAPGVTASKTTTTTTTTTTRTVSKKPATRAVAPPKPPAPPAPTDVRRQRVLMGRIPC